MDQLLHHPWVLSGWLLTNLSIYSLSSGSKLSVVDVHAHFETVGVLDTC